MKTISVMLCVSQNTNHVDLDFEDLDLTEEEYNNLSEEEKKEKIQLWVNDMNDQPYWMVDRITED